MSGLRQYAHDMVLSAAIDRTWVLLIVEVKLSAYTLWKSLGMEGLDFVLFLISAQCGGKNSASRVGRV